MSQLKPPFTLETAQAKVKVAQAAWNTQYHLPFQIILHNLTRLHRKPSDIVPAYTSDSIWRNRNTFLKGSAAIHEFLVKKWKREKSYRLRKELFAFSDSKIAVQFWYEYQDAEDGMLWKRCYGLEDWTFDAEGRMRKRMMSGNDLLIGEAGRWFVDGVNVDEVEIGEEHW